jgi:predicted glycosyltransferase
MDVVRKDWAVRLEVQNQLNKYHIDLNGAEKIKQHVKDLKHKRRLRTANAIN